MSLYKKEIKILGIDKDKCVSCKICVKWCPVDIIPMKEGKAKIDMEKCIRYEKCSQEAVKNDSEKIPLEIK